MDGKPGIRSYVSSRGVGFATDEDAQRKILDQLTDFQCGFCDYPVLLGWRFCPLCGGLLEWLALNTTKEIGK